jgi:hypothetical protein
VDCTNDPRVGPAAADIAVHEFHDLAFRRTRILFEQRNCRHDHARSAVAALQGIFVEKGLLNGVKLIAFRQTFYRRDLLLCDSCCFGYARPLRFAVDQYGAGAALAFAASVFCAGQIEIIAENTKQRGLGIGINREGTSVYNQAETAHSNTTSGISSDPSNDISDGGVDRTRPRIALATASSRVV